MKKLIGGGLAALALGLIMAPVAQATPDDDAFLQVVAEHGFASTSGNISDLIRLGHTVCIDLGNGYTLMEEVRRMQSTQDTYLTVGDAAYFIGAAHSSYCPWVNIAGTSVA